MNAYVEPASEIAVTTIAPRGKPIHCLRLAGTDRDIGRDRGRALETDLAAMWAWMRPKMSAMYGLPEDRWDAVAARCEENGARHAPWLIEQVYGMAETSPLSVRDLLLANAYGLIWNNTGHWCTSVAVITGDEGPLLGQNLDIAADDFYYAEEIRAEGAHATLGDAMLCLGVSPCGMNEAGLAVGTSNLAAPGQRGQPWDWTGVNYHHLARMVLRRCGTTRDAVAYLHELTPVIPSGGGYQFNLLDAAGERAVVDKCGPFTRVRQCEPDLNFTSNCTFDPDFERWRLGREGGNPDGQSRAARIRRAWSALAGTAPTRAWLVGLMSGSEGPGALCRVQPGHYSRLGFVYSPGAGRVVISNGPPDRNPYWELSFSAREP